MSDRKPALSGLIVGLGVMGSHHARVLSLLPEAALVGFVDPDAARRAELEQIHPGISSHADLDEALAAARPDFVCLAAPVEHLPRLARTVIEAGIPVLVEKPLAPTEYEARELIELARGRGVPLGVGHVERFNPAVTALKAKIDEGHLGEVYQIHARRLSPFPDRYASASVALDLATHDLDIMRYLTGHEVARVFAEVASRSATGAEDLICASLRFDGGTTGVLEANWLTPTKVRELTLTGERGMFVVNYLTQDLLFYENPRAQTEWEALTVMRGPGEGDMVRFALQRRQPLEVQWELFLAALRQGRSPPVTGWDGLAALSTARAIQLAGSSHQSVVPGYRKLELEAVPSTDSV